jgi:hypothetical protein
VNPQRNVLEMQDIQNTTKNSLRGSPIASGTANLVDGHLEFSDNNVASRPPAAASPISHRLDLIQFVTANSNCFGAVRHWRAAIQFNRKIGPFVDGLPKLNLTHRR